MIMPIANRWTTTCMSVLRMPHPVGSLSISLVECMCFFQMLILTSLSLLEDAATTREQLSPSCAFDLVSGCMHSYLKCSLICLHSPRVRVTQGLNHLPTCLVEYKHISVFPTTHDCLTLFSKSHLLRIHLRGLGIIHLDTRSVIQTMQTKPSDSVVKDKVSTGLVYCCSPANDTINYER